MARPTSFFNGILASRQILAMEFNGKSTSSVDRDSIASYHDRKTKERYSSGVHLDSSALSGVNEGQLKLAQLHFSGFRENRVFIFVLFVKSQ